MENDEKKSITECQLEDGRIVEYDMAHDPQSGISISQEWLDNFEYIGTGVIYRVDGVIQPERYYKPGLHFYKRVK